MNKNIITFVFQSGRTSRINNEKEEFSKEFFYSYQNFKTEFDKVNLIEFNNPKSFFNLITRPLFRALRYLTTIPFYCENIQSVKNYRILSNSDEIIFTNQRVAFSSMPMLLLSSIFKKKRSTVFIMGLFVEQSKNSVRKFFRLNFIKLLVKISSNLIFLSSSEKELASSIFPKNNRKVTPEGPKMGAQIYQKSDFGASGTPQLQPTGPRDAQEGVNHPNWSQKSSKNDTKTLESSPRILAYIAAFSRIQHGKTARLSWSASSSDLLV